MDGTKSPLRSLTVVAALASALASLMGVFGVQIDDDLADQTVNAITQLLSAGFAIIAIYGRVRATARIGRDG